MTGIEEVFSNLGLNRDNGLFFTAEGSWEDDTSFPNRIKRLINRKIQPNAFFCFDNKPIILFYENPSDKLELHKAIWNFNECPVVIISEGDSVEIFNGFKYEKDNKTLEKLGGIEQLNDFTYFELVTGRTWEQYNEHFNYKNRVDYYLLQNIKLARHILVGGDKSRAKLVNSILGKVIFVRYLIDREVKMSFDGSLRTWTNEEFCSLLDSPDQIKSFFDYLEDHERGFDGDLFPLTPDEYSQLAKQDYQVIKRLLLGEDIATNQRSLFELYDFSIIPIEFISNVYELFIGQDNQKKEGAYYTPLFLVDYILKETVEKSLKESSNYTCRVLDPACGSGIFLVETLRKIIEKYIDVSGVEIKSDAFKIAIKDLAKDNIYGIDKDLSAVQVAIFSIYLTLLDYLEPPGIETFTFPELFNVNFFEADFFQEESLFNTKLVEIEFDFIVGNPPWKGNGMNEVGNGYLKRRWKRERSLRKKTKIAVNNNEIAEGFMLRASDFSRNETRIAFIIRSSILYNQGYNKDDCSPFRQYLLEEYFIDKVFELAPVRYEVFEKSNQPAVAPAAVIFYRYANGLNTDNNIVQHVALKKSRFFSLFKIFTINRPDYKKIKQKQLKEYDWLWKVLVYGSYLDFNFLKRIKQDYPSIKDILLDKNRLIEGTGIQYSSDPGYDSTHLIGKPYIDSYGVSSFFLVPDKISSFEKSKVHRLRDERLFKAPMLLIREGIDMDTLTAKCVLSEEDLLFKDSITSIKVLNQDDVDILHNIIAVFSTSIFSYYAINTFASIGIERERVKNYNKYSVPYLELEVKESIYKIREAKHQDYLERQKVLIDNFVIQGLADLVNFEIDKINSLIYSQLALNDVEISLIDYAWEINRSLIIGDSESKKKLFTAVDFCDEVLHSYASIFIERFKPKLDSELRKFIVEVWYTKHLIGMFFKLVPVADFTSNIVFIDKQNSDLDVLTYLARVGSSKITDTLFIQKDVRGFERDYFYVFKPNEKRLWHKAIAYLDVAEFADAILKAGRAGQ